VLQLSTQVPRLQRAKCCCFFMLIPLFRDTGIWRWVQTRGLQIRESCRDISRTETEAGTLTLTLILTETDTESDSDKETETRTETIRHLAFDRSSKAMPWCQNLFGAESVHCRCEPQSAGKAHLSAHSALISEAPQTLLTLPKLRRWMDWILSNP